MTTGPEYDESSGWLATRGVLNEMHFERRRQDVKFGDQSRLKDGTGWFNDGQRALDAQQACDAMFKQGRGTWRHVLLEEVWEALAETDILKLRTELVQVASVAVAWIEALDVRE